MSKTLSVKDKRSKRPWYKQISLWSIIISGGALILSFLSYQSSCKNQEFNQQLAKDNQELANKLNSSELRILSVKKGKIEIAEGKVSANKIGVSKIILTAYLKIKNVSNRKVTLDILAFDNSMSTEYILRPKVFIKDTSSVYPQFFQPFSKTLFYPEEEHELPVKTLIILSKQNPVITTNLHVLIVYENDLKIKSDSYLIQEFTADFTTRDIPSNRIKVSGEDLIFSLPVNSELYKIDSSRKEMDYKIFTQEETKSLNELLQYYTIKSMRFDTLNNYLKQEYH